MSKVVAAVLALLGSWSTPLLSQEPAAVRLGAATATFADPFTQIGAVREVAGGRVIVTDPRDNVVQLVDMDRGSATRIGREGSGPGEFQNPRTLLALPHDETLLADPLQARFLRIDRTGKVVETLSYPPGMGAGMAPVGTDAQGRVYWEGSAIGGAEALTRAAGKPGEVQSADSVPVIRWNRTSGRVDTLLMVRGPQVRVQLGNSAPAGAALGMLMSMRSPPFPSRDAWGVAPDGRIAVARSAPYRVDIRVPGGVRVTGPVVTVQPLPLTARDKEEYLAAQSTGQRVTRSFGGGGTAPTSPSAPNADAYHWPATKPFFDAASVRMSPSGELWSLRSRVAGDDTPVYDVFDAAGKLVRRVTFPAKTRLVGFGQGTLYLARTDDDDLQYLERYTDCGMSGCESRGVPTGR